MSDTPDLDGLWQELRKLAHWDAHIQGPNALAKACLSALELMSQRRAPEVSLLVDRFLSWPLPESVCSDLCATKQGYPHRTGTNLLTAIEARQMLEYLLGDKVDDAFVVTDEMVTRFLNWPLPDSVCADLCASKPGYPSRVGTNLLTADEARQMLRYVLEAK
jgi:hypothetical protein